MRERLDCAVLLTRCTKEWVEPLLGQHAGGRLHLHALDIVIDIEAEGASSFLAAAAMALRRHDTCLLPVSPATLSWARTSLSLGMARLQTPVMALVRDLTAAGLHDLHELGVADFLRDPFCGHEARVRIERLLDAPRAAARARLTSPAVAEPSPNIAYVASCGELDPRLEHVCQNIMDHDGSALEAYAIAAASRSAVSRESFREAKSRVIERFERAYISAALGRHAGNIAMAARAAQKHRRAFWALMRKHDIDAAPYRLQDSSITQIGPAEFQAGAGAQVQQPGQAPGSMRGVSTSGSPGMTPGVSTSGRPGTAPGVSTSGTSGTAPDVSTSGTSGLAPGGSPSGAPCLNPGVTSGVRPPIAAYSGLFPSPGG